MASPSSATRPEDLSAQYADRWVIYRDLGRDGTHDEWVAEACDPTDGRKLTAVDVGSLAGQLAAETSRASDVAVPAAALWALREKWGPEWRVWRSRNGLGELNEWCATRRGVGRELSMTLMEPTADALENALVRQADGAPVYG